MQRKYLVLVFVAGAIFGAVCDNSLIQQHHASGPVAPGKQLQEKKVFATAINCMDGRTQNAVASFMKECYGASYTDQITEAGPVKILAKNEEWRLIDNIKKRVEISVRKHESCVIAIVAHDDCLGNPVTKEEQMRNLRAARETVKSFGLGVEIILLWVEGPDWTKAEVID